MSGDKLSHYFPDAQWSWSSEGDHSTLQWFGPGEKPTEQELADLPWPPPAFATAEEAKAAMVEWIDRMTAKVLSRYPESVRTRWPEEEAAARAIKAGTATPEQTTLITEEGAAKGRTPTEHADIIIWHADNFRDIAGEVNKLFLSVDAALDAETDPAQYEIILENAKAQAETLAANYGLV